MRTGDQEDDVGQEVCVDGTGSDSLHPTSTAEGHPDGPRATHHHTTATTTATATTATATASHLPPPPAYPCRDECTRCGKETTHDTPDTMKGQRLECSCDCHQNWQTQWQPPGCVGLPAAGHIPPTRPDCLPGCGYSGLPCFNCSITPHPHLHPHKGPTPEEESHPPHHVPTFSPQIYTIELMERPTTNAGDGDEEEVEEPQVSRHQQIIVEKEDWNARHMGISLMSCIIFIIVFIFIFKILFKGAAGYFW